MSLNVNQVAFATVTGLSVAAIAAGCGALMVTSTVASIALGILFGLGVAISLAATTAYFAPTSTTPHTYFKNIKNHVGYVVAGMTQAILQTFVHALVVGAARGVSKRTERFIAGPDVTMARAS